MSPPSAKKILGRLFEIVLSVLAMIIAALMIRWGWVAFYKSAYPVGFEAIVLEQSAQSGVPAALIFAVIRTESGFNPAAQSSVSARGLMQITPDTFEWARFRLKEDDAFVFEDLYDSETNIRYGVEILRLLLDEFGNDENALCAYHAGWGNTKKWLQNPEYAPDGAHIENIPFADTRRYVQKVTETKAIYERLYGAGEN